MVESSMLESCKPRGPLRWIWEMSLVNERWIDPLEKTTGGSWPDLDVTNFFVIFGVKEFLNMDLFP